MGLSVANSSCAKRFCSLSDNGRLISLCIARMRATDKIVGVVHKMIIAKFKSQFTFYLFSTPPFLSLSAFSKLIKTAENKHKLLIGRFVRCFSRFFWRFIIKSTVSSPSGLVHQCHLWLPPHAQPFRVRGVLTHVLVAFDAERRPPGPR